MKYSFLYLTVWICLSGSFIQAQGKDNFYEIPKLEVKGEATIFKPADQMEVTVSVVTQQADSKLAIQENNKKTQAMLDSLYALGLTNQDYQTSQFHIQPIYFYQESQLTQAPSISHYEVTNTVQIKTQRLDLAETIIGVVTQAGANQVSGLSFNLSHPQMYREEVIQLATKNAFSDARALAEAARVKLIRILFLTLDHNQLPMPLARNYRAASSEVSAPIPLEIGQVELRATVHMTFEIDSMYRP